MSIFHSQFSMLVNLQRKIPIDLKSLRAFIGKLSENIEEAAGKTFSVALVPDKRMRELNHLFRGKDKTTDVLSFPYESEPPASDGDHLSEPAASTGGQFADQQNFLGDIVISAEQANEQATENGLSLDLELKQLILHGLLHLTGHDHETDSGEMNQRELELRDHLGVA